MFAVFLDESGKVFNGSRAGVEYGYVLRACREELDGWEALDLVGNVIGCGVYFGDDDLVGERGVGGIQRGELFIFRGQTVGRQD